LGPEYSFTQESDDSLGPWPMTTQVYPTESLHIQVYDSAPQHPQLSLPIYPEQWNSYANCVLPNEGAQSSPNLMMTNNYSPSGSNSLSPFAMQSSSLPPSSVPRLSPTISDPTLSPLYSSSRFGTPNTPGSSHSFMPSPTSPTLSQDHLVQQDSQVSTTSDVCHIYVFI
jgi:hypothetical protein